MCTDQIHICPHCAALNWNIHRSNLLSVQITIYICCAKLNLATRTPATIADSCLGYALGRETKLTFREGIRNQPWLCTTTNTQHQKPNSTHIEWLTSLQLVYRHALAPPPGLMKNHATADCQYPNNRMLENLQHYTTDSPSLEKNWIFYFGLTE